jgi:hypothetical protein
MEIHESGSENNKDETGTSPSVKKYAEQKQNNVLVFVACEVIDKNEKREEI